MTTKEKILDTALELFSRQGYDGASVRDIARAVGIRESSLYNHFPSKRALFDGIVDFCVQQAELYFRGSGLPFDQGDDTSLYQGIPAERLHALIERTFRYFFDDPWNARFRRLLLLSQFAEPRCRDIYRQLYRDKCVQVQAFIFSALMDRGELRREDPLAVAAEFHGPMFMLIHTCGSFEEARPLIRAHVEQFQKNYAWRDQS
ncbi:MAG: TetR/AcrR family transcriptional regulator [Oscillospiraceae bacterium]|jgi:AcrR family transcriptional regulator|nr:TetR/AcrR family transcriptional regulator [Oscillospiraceae bacterium]